MEHATTDELDGTVKVYKYQKDPMSGSTAIAGIRSDLFSGKK
jgi:hypothetical protein